MNPLLMYVHKKPGFLITFCGLDGCGKTTQIHLLEDYLRAIGADLLLTKQPTPFVRQSEIFRNYMDQPNHGGYDYRSLSLLAASDRVQHSNNVILPALEQGKIVVSDRYFYSCIGNLRARGYTEDTWIYEVSGFIPKPDLAFFIDVDVQTAVERVRTRPEEKDRHIDMALQYQLRKQYSELAKCNGGIVLSGSTTVEETFTHIKTAVDQMLLNASVRSVQAASYG